MKATLLAPELEAVLESKIVDDRGYVDPAIPLVQFFPTANTWRLVQDFEATYQGHRIKVRAPFDYDLASVPRRLWSLLGCHELGLRAPLYHDLLYRSGGQVPTSWATIYPFRRFDRGEADRMFLTMMAEDGISWLRRNAAYLAVRMFGGGSWRG